MQQVYCEKCKVVINQMELYDNSYACADKACPTMARDARRLRAVLLGRQADAWARTAAKREDRLVGALSRSP